MPFTQMMLHQNVASYENLQIITSGQTVTVTGNNTSTVSFYKTASTAAWDTQAYCPTGFTAPCTIEFKKNASSADDGLSYAMMSWNADPTTDASYSSLDWAVYPYATSNYQVYHNGTNLVNGGTWNSSLTWYLVYHTNGYIYHYNGSNQIYSVNKGTGGTVYLDSSMYSVSATNSGFYNVRVIKQQWDGTSYR